MRCSRLRQSENGFFDGGRTGIGLPIPTKNLAAVWVAPPLKQAESCQLKGRIFLLQARDFQRRVHRPFEGGKSGPPGPLGCSWDDPEALLGPKPQRAVVLAHFRFTRKQQQPLNSLLLTPDGLAIYARPFSSPPQTAVEEMSWQTLSGCHGNELEGGSEGGVIGATSNMIIF